MSERVSSVEIEDVLSSIRRLVSEELRPMRPTGSPVAVATRGSEFEDEPEAEAGFVPRSGGVENRLVLTASLRVLPSDDTEDETAAEKAAVDTTSSEPGAEIRQDAEAWDESWQQEGEDPLAGASWAGRSEPAAGAAREPTASAATPSPNEDDEPADALPPAAGHRFSFSVARSAFDEDDAAIAAAESAAEEVEPVSRLELTADLAISSTPWAQPVAGNRDAAAAPHVEPATPPRGFGLREDPAWADAAAAEAIEDAEAGIASGSRDAPEAAVRSAPRSTAKAEPPSARVSYLHTAEPAEARVPGPHTGEIDNPDEAPEELILEEAALREIIREVVREELAGSLGGRITRNVRKLVRGEIAQMLASRTME